jgi:hypothetical protein
MVVLQAASNFKEPRIMPRNNLRYGTLLVCGVLALAGGPAPADDGKVDKEKPTLSGKWENKDAEPKLELKFSGERDLTIFPHGENFDLRLDCSYTVTKEGLVKVKITRLGGRQDLVDKVKEALPVGKEFEFKWKAETDTAKLEAVQGEDIEHLKGHLEGDYAKKP